MMSFYAMRTGEELGLSSERNQGKVLNADFIQLTRPS